MATATTSPNHEDVPFTVQDRRRKGFFLVDNALFDQYGSRLGPYGLAVYMALARFANQEGTCWPSLSTIAKKTGMSRPQVIREIAKLKDHSLIAVEHQVNDKGNYSSNLYILLDIALPTPEPGVVSDRDQSGIREILPLVSTRDQGSISERPKQDSQNKTQHRRKTQRTHRRAIARERDEKAINEDVVVLTNLGVAKNVARKLVGHYNRERIMEKIAYLEFLQEADPGKVQNPCGWLRCAIEENYATPDGYVSKQERERQKAELWQQEQEQKAMTQEIQAQQMARREALVAQYGTSEEDHTYWEKAKWEIKFTTPAHIAELVTYMDILKVREDAVVISVDRHDICRQLKHPGTKKALQKVFTHVAGHTVEMEVVLDKVQTEV